MNPECLDLSIGEQNIPVKVAYPSQIRFMESFSARIEIIGVNPFVFLPPSVLSELFIQAQRDKGPVPVRGKIEGKDYKQTLVKYRGYWRLYINSIMLKSSERKTGDTVNILIEYDPDPRILPTHPGLRIALNKNSEARLVFDKLSLSRQQEIIRYLNSLKNKITVEKNIERAIQFLIGNGTFVGREKP
jgi:hypothetical protein